MTSSDRGVPAFSLWAGLILLLGGCGAADDLAVSANLPVAPDPPAGGSWYSPSLATTWQWQLTGTVNTGYDVDLYDVDLFDTPADDIAALQSAGRRVVCYFSGGSSEDWRPDFADFDERALGRALGGWEGEKWLDVRAQSVVDVAIARLDLAVTKGCDGVEPDNMDGFSNRSGFDLTADDQLAYNRFMANAARVRGLAVGLKNDGDQAAELVDWFDFEVNEQCHEYDECAQLAPFTTAGKPIFNAEYETSAARANALATQVCPLALAANIRALILPLDLDDSFRVSCDP